MFQESYVINKVRYTVMAEGNKVHYEACRHKCTGHGRTAIEALIDLRKKIKLKYPAKKLNSI